MKAAGISMKAASSRPTTPGVFIRGRRARLPRGVTPLFLCGVALLLYAALRMYSLHGDLHEVQQHLIMADARTNVHEQKAILDFAAEEQQMPNTTDVHKLLAYPHVDECRQCQVCIPQYLIDEQLGNGSSSSSGSRWFKWLRRKARQRNVVQQQQTALQHPKQQPRRRLLHEIAPLHAGPDPHRDGSSQRQPWHSRQKHWQAAAAAVGEGIVPWAFGPGLQSPSSSHLESLPQLHEQHKQHNKLHQQLPHLPYKQEPQHDDVQSAWGMMDDESQEDGGDEQVQRQVQEQPQRQWRRRLQQQRQRLDGVKTHKAWLAKHGSDNANTNTHAVPGIEVILDMPDNSFNWQGHTYHIGPASLQMDQHKIRSCAVCRGCKQMLRRMPTGMHWLGSTFKHDPGASNGWIMWAQDPQSNAPSAVKVWCVPVPKPGRHVPAVCKPTEIREQLQLLLALQDIAKDCQLDELLPRHWVSAVDGILPGSHGYRVTWDGLWADLVEGVSAENLAHRGDPPVMPHLLLEYMQQTLNSTQVVLAAIFDLLFSQCDRHGQNLYLKPDGSLVLIDNDQAFGASWRPCGVDSLFLPGTQKFEVERLGFSYVLKKPEYAPTKIPRNSLDPLQLLDYRCHVPKGKLGTAYPKPVKKCLQRLARSTPDDIARKYGYPNQLMAAAIHQRAKDMLSKGFEWTLKYGYPQNPSPTRYKWAKGCCKMQPTVHPTGAAIGSQQQHGPYECTEWVDEELGWPTDLPVGDPVAVMAWEHNGIDTGSYNLTQEWMDVS